MKKNIFFLVMLSLIALIATAQDKEPAQLTFRVHGINENDTVHLNPDCYS